MMPDVPLPKKKKNNHINKDEAEKIGEFLVSIGEEISESNATLRKEALGKAEERGASEYFRIGKVDAEYTLSIRLKQDSDNSERQKESEVTMTASYDRISSSMDTAPFNVLFGVISPAEQRREEIGKVLDNLNTPMPFDAPIFSIKPGVFWVIYPDSMTHYVVSLNLPNEVRRVDDLNTLNELTASLFLFLQKQLAKTYGAQNG